MIAQERVYEYIVPLIRLEYFTLFKQQYSKFLNKVKIKYC